MAWWSSLWRSKATDWSHGWIGNVQMPNVPGKAAVAADKHYLTLSLRAMRIAHVRQGLKKLFGAVHCFSRLAHNRQGEATFHSFTTPANLKGIDAAHVDRVITLQKALLGPVPYRGGPLSCELALFSIAATDLAEPFLSVLEGLADAVGVSYIGVATDVARQVAKGIESISSSPDGSTLEIGLDADLLPVETGCYAVLREPRRDVSKLTLAADGRLLDENGKVLGSSYLVFSVETTTTREDWRRIPELREAYQRLEAPVLRGSQVDAKPLLGAFERIVRLSPDLLADDADQICSKVVKRINSIMSATPVGREKSNSFPSLEEY